MLNTKFKVGDKVLNLNVNWIGEIKKIEKWGTEDVYLVHYGNGCSDYWEVEKSLTNLTKEIDENKTTKPTLETNKETGTMKIDNIEFTEEQTKALNHFLESFEKKVTEEVCSKIKDFTAENWDYDDFTYFLNKLEQGE